MKIHKYRNKFEIKSYFRRDQFNSTHKEDEYGFDSYLVCWAIQAVLCRLFYWLFFCCNLFNLIYLWLTEHSLNPWPFWAFWGNRIRVHTFTIWFSLRFCYIQNGKMRWKSSPTCILLFWKQLGSGEFRKSLAWNWTRRSIIDATRTRFNTANS